MTPTSYVQRNLLKGVTLRCWVRLRFVAPGRSSHGDGFVRKESRILGRNVESAEDWSEVCWIAEEFGNINRIV
jgi:hypothetical protein